MICTSCYALNEKRKGALLRVQFDEGLIGYADCHPWIEFGDLPLAEQVARLKKGELTPLTRQSIYWARIDAEARKKKRSLFPSTIPLSHFLVLNLNEINVPEYYQTIKLKVNRNLEPLRQWLEWGCEKKKKFAWTPMSVGPMSWRF